VGDGVHSGGEVIGAGSDDVLDAGASLEDDAVWVMVCV
jgi:hypothetical protein